MTDTSGSGAGGLVLGDVLEKRLREQTKAWRDDLVNLTRMNRLLYFRPTSSTTLELVAPAAQAILDRLSGTGSLRFFEPQVDPDGQPLNSPAADDLVAEGKSKPELERGLRGLERRSTQDFIDRGIWTLHLGLGVLEWVDPDDGKRVSSPLLLVPVTLIRDGLGQPFKLCRSDDDSAINPALTVKMASDFGVTMPAIDDVDDTELASVLAAVEAAIEDHPDWTVKERAVLATFTFNKEAMYRDLLDNEDAILAHPLIQAIGLGPDAPDGAALDFEPVADDQLDEVARPEQSLSVLDADSSQRRCIYAATEGQSFVMDGPPGTGKSQTITNMIAELIGAGKTVLFVSEKAAALDVVHSRLSAAGLDSFVLELHSHKATRKAVAGVLGAALRERPRASGSITDERLAALKRDREQLSAYAQALNEVRRPLGRSLHQVLGRLSQLDRLPHAPTSTSFSCTTPPEQLADILAWADALGRAWGPVERGDRFLWRGLAETARSQRNRVADQLVDARQAITDLAAATSAVRSEIGLTDGVSTGDAERLLVVLELLDDRADLPSAWLTASSVDTLVSRVDDLRQLTGQAATTLDRLHTVIGTRWAELATERTESLQQRLSELHDLLPEITPDATETDLTRRRQPVDATTKLLAEIDDDIRTLARSFGFSETGLTLAKVDALVALSQLVGSNAAPEGAWFDPASQAALDEAARVLGAVLADYRGRQQALGDVFTPEVLSLDLRSLNARFASVHTGLHKFGGACRADRRIVAAVTVAKRADKATLARLPDALAWQQIDEALRRAEDQHVGLIGARYYPDRATADIGRVVAAIGLAQHALALAADDAQPGALASQLSLDAQPSPHLLAAGRRVQTHLAGWTNLAAVAFGPSLETLRQRPLADMRRWTATTSGHLGVLGGALSDANTFAGKVLSCGTMLAALHDAREASSLLDAISEREPQDRAALGGLYAGLYTQWERVTNAIEWITALRDATGSPLSDRQASRLLSAVSASDDLRTPAGQWEKAVAGLLQNFTAERASELRADLEGDFADTADLLDAFASSTADMSEWDAHSEARDYLDAAGLEPAVSYCAAHRVDAAELPAIIERSLLEGWADDVIDHDTARLGRYRSQDRDALVVGFRELDRRRVAAAASEIVNRCSQMRPTSTAGVAGIIQREAEKKTRHKPIRRLLGEAGTVAQTLKPCFMMSPLSVSQYLPSTMRFDAVIFDEASQVRPGDAINCIYRGDQLIVAGDKNQLPPSSFFARDSGSGDDEYDDDQLDEFESVLDLCKASGAIRSLPLNWHYRSAHESLITYSNYRFYEGRLFTFPGATHQAPDLGIELFKVNGTYRRGGARDNPIEAAKVIERVLHHRQLHPDLSIGVVTFSDAQETAVQAELEHQTTIHPELAELGDLDRLNGFFVKNLESVQGDERDIIIFSVGYGPDENGKFLLNLGPLNRQGGWRRLNVAITRARRRVEVVTSVLPEQFHGDSSSEGVRHLRGYLDFALRGTPALALDISEGGDAESVFEEEVIRAISSWGYEAVPQVGVAGYRLDIGVRHPAKPGSYVLGVECDGAMYHSSKTARDRDRLRQGVLESLGWQLHRIWGISWYRERAAQEARLRRAIEGAIEGRTTQTRPVPTPVLDVVIDEAALDETPQWVVAYQEAALQPVRSRLELHEPDARPDIRRRIVEVVTAEQPVHEDRVLRRVLETWGVERAGARIRENFAHCLSELRSRELIQQTDSFLSLRGVDTQPVRGPSTNGYVRPVRHVPPTELNSAVLNLMGDVHAISRRQLPARTARLFGWNRLGSEISDAIEDTIDELASQQLVTISTDELVTITEKGNIRTGRHKDR